MLIWESLALKPTITLGGQLMQGGLVKSKLKWLRGINIGQANGFYTLATGSLSQKGRGHAITALGKRWK